jgi:hypothetical protein
MYCSVTELFKLVGRKGTSFTHSLASLDLFDQMAMDILGNRAPLAIALTPGVSSCLLSYVAHFNMCRIWTIALVGLYRKVCSQKEQASCLFKTYSQVSPYWLRAGVTFMAESASLQHEPALIRSFARLTFISANSLEVECDVAIVVTRVQFPVGALFISLMPKGLIFKITKET